MSKRCSCRRLGLMGMIFSLAALTARAGPPVATTRIGFGYRFPVFVISPPGDVDRLFVVEKRGVIRILNLATSLPNALAFLNIDGLVGGGTATNSERGLLGLAFHPNYASNGFFYVHYTNNSGSVVIARYTVSANPDVANAASALILRTIAQPQSNHNGGWIGFGPNDGYLYISLGDGGNFCDTGSGHSTGGNAQDITNNLLGKILRIDVDGTNGLGGNYGIPPGNPFVGVTGDDEIWAYGLRNPWRCSFDRLTGDLYIGDVGQDAREEVDYQSASSGGGENYGWRCMEGNACTGAPCTVTTGCTCGSPALTMPIHAYSHNPPPAPAGFVCSVTGGYVYRGCKMPGLSGTYFFADFCGGTVWSFEVAGGLLTNFADRTGQLSPSIEGATVNQVSSFGEDGRGELYIVDQGSGFDGQIFKIISATTPIADCDGNGRFELGPDVACFVDALLGTDTNPPGGICRSDLNGDNRTDGRDIEDFVACAIAGCP